MTPNKEDYIKCIYEIGLQTTKISNKDIAERMQVSRPAVTEMIKKLLEEHYIEKNKNTGYLLTDLGQQFIADIYRKHRLLEVFLMEQLNYSSDQVHQEAEILEHSVSELFIDRLDKLLNYPTTCPHGGSIPAKNTLLVEQYTQPLNQGNVGTNYTLSRVHDEKPVLQFLDSHQLKRGDSFLLESHDAYTQTCVIHHNNHSIVIPNIIAKQLFIEQ